MGKIKYPSFVCIFKKESVMRKIFLIFILFFIIVHFTLNIENCVCQWITQDWPYFEIVQDVKFLDENTGFYAGFNGANGGFYKTTNSGFNWTQIYFQSIFQIQKIDSTTIYLNGRDIQANDKIYRSYDKGITWDTTTREERIPYHKREKTTKILK
jgi:hypothetical protein